jgi:hypothetical protein
MAMRTRVRLAIAGIATIAVVAAAGLGVKGWWLGSRSDRAAALRLVETASDAVPQGAIVISRQTSEARWTHCDSGAGHPGWTPAMTVVRFSSSEPSKTVVAEVAASLERKGWHLDERLNGSGALWTTSTKSGPARAALGRVPPLTGSVWEFTATATPGGMHATGC